MNKNIYNSSDVIPNEPPSVTTAPPTSTVFNSPATVVSIRGAVPLHRIAYRMFKTYKEES